MSKKQRRQPSLKERMTPCVVCLHPLSQKHHLLSFSIHGDKGVGTVQLCANCHDLYHLFERYARKMQKGNSAHLLHVETQEEKLIERLGSYPIYSPLVTLASVAAGFHELASRNGSFDTYSQEDKDRVIGYLQFIADFKYYVEGERKKRDAWFRANGSLMFSMLDEVSNEQ